MRGIKQSSTNIGCTLNCSHYCSFPSHVHMSLTLLGARALHICAFMCWKKNDKYICYIQHYVHPRGCDPKFYPVVLEDIYPSFPVARHGTCVAMPLEDSERSVFTDGGRRSSQVAHSACQRDVKEISLPK